MTHKNPFSMKKSRNIIEFNAAFFYAKIAKKGHSSGITLYLALFVFWNWVHSTQTFVYFATSLTLFEG